MKRNTAALAALGTGIAAGAAIRATGNVALADAANILRPLGTLWLNGLRMTLVPLVFAMVANGMIELDRRGGGERLLGIALPLLIGLLALAMTVGMGLGLLFEQLWPAVPGALASLDAAPAGAAVATTPSVSDLIVGLVPANPIAAASDGNMAAIVVFAVIFGFAVSRGGAAGEPLAHLVHSLAEAMIRIVHWVLWFTPLGIFVLSLGLALDSGLAVAGFVAQLVITVIAAALLATLCGYLLAWLGGGIAPARFGAAIIGAQAMAAGTCSSAATLPLMLETSERKLGISEAVGGAVLPLAVSIFRFSVAFYQGAVVILLMHTAGLPLDPAKLLAGGAILILSNLGVAGVPGAAIMYASWSAGLAFLGLPIGVVPLLIAANALPDIFVTVGNVTADLAVTTIVARLLGRRRAGQGSPPSEAARTG